MLKQEWIKFQHKKYRLLFYRNRPKLSETWIACVDATEFLSDVYDEVHELKNPWQIPARRVSILYKGEHLPNLLPYLYQPELQEQA